MDCVGSVFEGAKHPFRLNLVHIDGKPVGYGEGEEIEKGKQVPVLRLGYATGGVGIEAQIPAQATV